MAHAHKNKSIGKRLLRLLLITFGAVLVAVALELFLVPNGIIDGGVVGIAIMTAELSGIKLGILLFVLNLPFLFLGYKQIGKTFAVSTLYAVIVMSVSTFFLHKFHYFEGNTVLAAMFGGVLLGVGVGIVIKNGASLDGTEILAIMFNKKLPFSVGQIVMFMNFFILGSATFVFGLENAMYSLFAYYIAFKAIDITMQGLDETKSVMIFTSHPEDIGQSLLNRLGRGVTYLHGEGGYTGDSKKIVFCIITRLEEAKLKTIVEEIDDRALIAIGNMHDVKGEGFKKKDIH